MIKKTKFSKASKERGKTLSDRINYISDPTHPNHIGKNIFAAKNYLCEDNSPEAFENKAVEVYGKYDRHRKGKQGNRSKKLFEEHIFSSPEGAFLSEKEKGLLEKAVIDDGFCFVAVRTAWHDNPHTGRSDLHILSAGYTEDIPPRVHLTTDFGHGKRDFLLTLERAERDALDVINSRREKSRKIFSAREVKRKNMKKAGVETLSQKLAAVWDGTNQTIKEALQKLGYRVERLTKKSVSVISAERLKSNSGKAPRPRRYNLDTLREGLSLRETELKQPETKTKVKEPKKSKSPKLDTPPL